MEILAGQQAANQKEANTLALQAAGIDGISSDIVDMFASLADAGKTSREGERIIVTALRSRYGGKATWRTEQWLVPVPKLHYQGKDIPKLIIEITTYVIAAAKVETLQYSSVVTLAGAVGKPTTMAIPVVFFHALLDKDLRRFGIVEKDAIYTTWEIPGAKPVRLSHEFVSVLAEILASQPVVTWLEKFGDQGRAVAPLVAGSLLGMMFQDSSRPVPVNEETITIDNLVKALESLAYKPAEAQEMVRCAAPRLRADMTLEEAIRITLQTGAGGN